MSKSVFQSRIIKKKLNGSNYLVGVFLVVLGNVFLSLLSKLENALIVS